MQGGGGGGMPFGSTRGGMGGMPGGMGGMFGGMGGMPGGDFGGASFGAFAMPAVPQALPATLQSLKAASGTMIIVVAARIPTAGCRQVEWRSYRVASPKLISNTFRSAQGSTDRSPAGVHAGGAVQGQHAEDEDPTHHPGRQRTEHARERGAHGGREARLEKRHEDHISRER